jgi:hypothetical protein
MSNDDWAAFEAEKQHCIQAMSQDKSLFDIAVQLLLVSDKYRYSYL